MRQVRPHEARKAMIEAFIKWGLPQRIRLDNGHPFAHTRERDLPTNLALWVVALGIEPIFNRPYSPQQNGTVECMQRVSGYWATPESCATPQELQKRLDKVSFDHVHVYRSRAHGDRTRLERYPQLLTNPRRYKPGMEEVQRACNYLAQFVLRRKVFSNGRVSIAGFQWTVGLKYRGQQVSICFHPHKLCWQVFQSDGVGISESPKLDFTKQALNDLTILSKN